MHGNEATQDLALTLSCIPLLDCLLHFLSPSHFHDTMKVYWVTESSKHRCDAPLLSLSIQVLCFMVQTIPHVPPPPPPRTIGYCRTNMCTNCQTVPWVLRTHQLWWRSPPLNPYRSYLSPGSWRYCNQANWYMLRLVGLFSDPITQETFIYVCVYVSQCDISPLALVPRLGDRVVY